MPHEPFPKSTMRDWLSEGVCPDSEDPTGFDTCTMCRAETDGFYDDDGFTCYACSRRAAQCEFDTYWQPDPVPQEPDCLPF